MSGGMKNLSEEEFLVLHADDGKELKSLVLLQTKILNKFEVFQVMFESFSSLNKDYLKLIENALVTPDSWNNESIIFHIRSYFLMFIYVSDSYFFLLNGRMVGLNSKTDESVCKIKNDFFNSDYAPDKYCRQVNLCDCSLEGFEFYVEKFLKPIKRDAKRVPMVS